MNRRALREEVFKLTFERELIEYSLLERLDYYFSDNDISDEDKKFFETYLTGITKNRQKIVDIIESKLENWTFEKLGNIEKSLLILSVYEIEYEKLGIEIVINEAIELAKRYGDDKTPEFINGVLAKVVN